MSVIALDIGTSRVKAVLARADGTILVTRSAPTPVHAETGIRHEFPVEGVRLTAETLVLALAADAADDPAATIVISCLGSAMAPVDRDGRPLGAALSPADPRPLATPGLRARIGLSDERLSTLTGSDGRLGSFLLTWLWWQASRPADLARAHRLRSLRGAILDAWTGADAEDPSWASRTMVMDLVTEDWSLPILASAGVDRSLLPPIHPATTSWPVEPGVRERLRLAPTASVVLGAMDNCCAFLGAADPSESRLANIAGTYEHMAGVGAAPVVRAAATAVDGLIHRYPLEGWDLGYSRVPMGLLLGEIAAVVGQAGLARLLDRVAASPAGVRLTPDVTTVRHALASGMPAGTVLQGVLESGAAVLATFADAWLAAGGSVDRIVAVGGGAGHERVLQLKARLLDRPISTLATEEAAALGALRLAAIATDGISAAEACDRFPNPVVHTWRPSRATL